MTPTLVKIHPNITPFCVRDNGPHLGIRMGSTLNSFSMDLPSLIAIGKTGERCDLGSEPRDHLPSFLNMAAMNVPSVPHEQTEKAARSLVCPLNADNVNHQ
jgi:hypothetical protein